MAPQETGISHDLMPEREGWCQPEEECVFGKEISHSSDNLLDRLAGEIGDHDLLVMDGTS